MNLQSKQRMISMVNEKRQSGLEQSKVLIQSEKSKAKQHKPFILSHTTWPHATADQRFMICVQKGYVRLD
jgi:hypothetical protein